MISLDETIDQIGIKLKQGENSSLKLSSALKDIEALKNECTSLKDENTQLKHNLESFLRKLYISYDERENLFSKITPSDLKDIRK